MILHVRGIQRFELFKHFSPQVIRPYVDEDPDHFFLLILDNFKCHCQPSFMRLCADTPNLQLDLLPPNCTSFLQPLDVGLNKPMKHYLTQSWTSWAVDAYKARVPGEAIVLVKPGRVQVAKWVCDAWDRISESNVIHSFMKVTYIGKIVIPGWA
jgi:hypothetical protein